MSDLDNLLRNITISHTVESMPPSGIRKFFQLTATIPDAISLSIGEPDFVTPWSIRETGIYALEKGYTMYTANEGLFELREEISKHLKLRYGLEYDPQTEILITTGTSEALDLSLRALLNPGEEVIIPDPCYVAYPACVSLAGGSPISIPTTESENFNLKADALKKYITKRTKAIIIGNPANPTGSVFSKKELKAIAAVAYKHKLVVIADEIYSKLVYDTEHTCFATLEGMQPQTILIDGFSKAYAMTGWRVGFAAGHRKFISAMTKVHQYTMLCAPILGQMAAVEALKHNSDDVNAMVKEYNQRRKYLLNGLRDIGLSCVEPKGAFYIFPSIKKTGLTSEEFATRLLQREKVAVVPGTAFGKCGEGYVRCCYATSMADIKEAIKRMRRFLKSI